MAGFFLPTTLSEEPQHRQKAELTLQSDYPAQDRLEAMKKDLDFARKHLNDAYQKVIEKTTSPQPSKGPPA